MLSKSLSWLANALVSIATVATVLFATGRSNKSTYAVSLRLGTNSDNALSNAYDYLCQISSIPLPDPENPETGNPPPGDGSPPSQPVPESSGVGGLAILAGLWTGVALMQRSAHRQKSKSVSSGKE